MAEKPRILQNSRDLAMTLIPLLALCLLVFFASGNCGRTQDMVPGVPPKPLAETAAQSLDFPVRLPAAEGFTAGVPEGWKVSAGRQPELAGGKSYFSLSYITDDKRLVELAQSNAGADELVQAVAGNVTQTGTVPVDGTQWRVFSVNDKDRSTWALTLPDGVTLALNGDATVPQFQVIAEAVQGQQPLPAR